MAVIENICPHHTVSLPYSTVRVRSQDTRLNWQYGSKWKYRIFLILSIIFNMKKVLCISSSSAKTSMLRDTIPKPVAGYISNANYSVALNILNISATQYPGTASSITHNTFLISNHRWSSFMLCKKNT